MNLRTILVIIAILICLTLALIDNFVVNNYYQYPTQINGTPEFMKNGQWKNIVYGEYNGER